MDLLRVGDLKCFRHAPQVSRDGSPVSNLGLPVRPHRFCTRRRLAHFQHAIFQASRIHHRNCVDGRWIAAVFVLPES